ncbi:MAG: lipopolysaccharide biosynthesis protein [Chloroflexota bacterium]
MLRNWVAENRVLLRNIGSLVATTGITSALGFGFWLSAARFFSPGSVGLASAAISAMTIMSQFGMFGMGTLLLRELPKHLGERTTMISTATIAVAAVAGAIGLLFALAAGHAITGLSPLDQSVPAIILFAAGVSVTAATLVLDAAMIGLLRGGLQLWRNTTLACTKLVALIAVGVLTHGSWMAIYGTWILGNLVSLVVLFFKTYSRQRPIKLLLPRFELLRGLGRSALSHHALNQSLSIASLTLPLIVTAMLSTAANAYFYMAWMIAGIASLALSSVTYVLYAVGSAAPTSLARRTRSTLTMSLAIAVSATVALLIVGHIVLQIIGPAYAQHATASLRILIFASFPLIVRTHFVTLRRLAGKVFSTALIVSLGAGGEVAGAIIGAHLDGLTGLSAGWVLGMCVEGVAMSPVVWRVASGRRRLVVAGAVEQSQPEGMDGGYDLQAIGQ